MTYDLKGYYFRIVQEPDVPLLRIRKEDYGDSTAEMIRDCQESLLAHSQANHKRVREAIGRLERLANAEAELAGSGLSIEGVPVTSLSQLLEKYESERHNHRITKIIKTPA